MELEYTIAGTTTKLGTKFFSVDPNFGIVFYDDKMMTNRMITWDLLDSFSLSGKPTEEQVALSKAHQRLKSDKTKLTGSNTTTLHG